MNLQTFREKFTALAEKLNSSYQPTTEKPLVKIAELTLILPSLGLFYLWEYFNQFGIEYFLYFDLKDAVSVLYQGLMPAIYISVILSLLVTILIPDLFRRRGGGDASVESGSGARQSGRNGFSILAIIIITIVVLMGFYVLLKAYGFPTTVTFIFLIFAGLAGYVYLFVQKNLGFGIGILLAFMYMFFAAKKDARYTATVKPRFDIVLRNHSDAPILSEKDTCKYFIYKTSGYYFIKDECTMHITAYSVSSQETTSFTAK